jgi:molecular chaperone GrpE
MNDDDRSESRPAGGPRRPGGPVRPGGRAAQRPGDATNRRTDDDDPRRPVKGRSGPSVTVDGDARDTDDASEADVGEPEVPDVDDGIPAAASAVDDGLVVVDADAVAEVDGDLPDLDSLDGADELRAVAEFLREELVTTRIERDETRDTLLRIKAEFDNYRKRTLREQTEHASVAAIGLLEQILPALDSFDSAVASPPDTLDDDDLFVSGVRAVRAQLLELLNKEGLERIDPDPDAGDAFDPNVHEAVATVPGDGPGQTVSRVFRPGYAMHGRLIRPAMVEVSG